MKKLFLTLILLLLTACQSDSGQLTLNTSIPPTQGAPATPTLAITDSPPLPTPQTTSTLGPAATPTPIADPTETETVPPTIVAATSDPKSEERTEVWSSARTDGGWIAVTDRAVIEIRDESDQTIIDYRENIQFRIQQFNSPEQVVVIDEIRNAGLGANYPAVVHWSANDESLLFTERAIADGCSVFDFVSGLWSLDLASGETTAINIPDGIKRFALSNQADRIAYLIDETVYIANLDDLAGQTITVAIDNPSLDVSVGGFHWSPDDSRLSVVVATDQCRNGWTEQFWSADTLSGDAELIYQTPVGANQYSITAWQDATTLMLSPNFESTLWLLDTSLDNAMPYRLE